MTTRLSAPRYRTRRPEPVAPLRAPTRAAMAGDMLFAPDGDGFESILPAGNPAPGQPPEAPQAMAPQGQGQNAAQQAFPGAGLTTAAAAAGPGDVAAELDAIRREGLTGRQLRIARRASARLNLPATSDFDAVRLLRRAGVDPFQRGAMMDLGEDEDEPPVTPGAAHPLGHPPSTAMTPASNQLPQVMKPLQVPSTEVRAEENHAADIMRIQRDIARRRRKKLMALAARMAFFVMLPTLLAGFYYYFVATPLYSTRTEFVIQQSASPMAAAAGGLGSMLQGSPLATSQDSIAVQGYLTSLDAMLRLDKDHGFRSAYSAEAMDPIQRLDPQGTQEEAYKIFKRNIQISYDPTEGVIKMEVIAPDPQLTAEFSRALIGYAEEQVDQLTQRVREDQMTGAMQSYENAKMELDAANQRAVSLQESTKILNSEVEVSLIAQQIGQLEAQVTIEKLSLAQMEANSRPNQARMQPIKRRIEALEAEIAMLRAKMTDDDGSGSSLADVQSQLLIAKADVETRQLLLSQSLAALDAARMEANRQVRYLSVSVNPVVPDEPSYPRAFENTLVAFLVFAGIYLMVSMTAAILREQVSA